MNNFYHSFFLKGACSIMMVFFLSSCWPEPLEVKDVPSAKPEIVVATQLIPDQAIVVWLSSTFGILDKNIDSEPEEVLKEIVVNDALVTISSHGQIDTLRFFERGFYGGLVLPLVEGQSYDLQVRSEALGEVKATASVQKKVDFQSLEAGIKYNMYDDTLVQLVYSIADPVEKNWYMINVQKIGEEGLEFLQDPINPVTITYLINDNNFNGEIFEEQLEFSQEGIVSGDSVAISLSNISEEYYRFMELRLENRLGLIEFLSEPLNYPTNVEGGKGYFNLHVPDVKVLPLKVKK